MSSVGWVYDPVKFPYTARNLSINVVRHAISVDERRWFFRQNRMYQTGAQDLKECWFQGFIRTSEAVIARANGREVKGDLGCFSAPKQLTKEGKARRLTYCCGRTGRLITTSIPVCPAFLK